MTYLIVYVGLAWLLTAPAMAVLTGKVIALADRRSRPEWRMPTLEVEARYPVAGHR